MGDSFPIFPATSQFLSALPVDLTVAKNPITGDFTVTDVNSNLVFRVGGWFWSPRNTRVLLDSTGNPVASLLYQKGGGWQCYDSTDCQDLIFRVEILSISRFRTELKVFPSPKAAGRLGPMGGDLRVKGSSYRRSCTIYNGNSIIAQASPMFKLGKIVVGRYRFRLTIYPGIDRALIVAIVVIFFTR